MRLVSDKVWEWCQRVQVSVIYCLDSTIVTRAWPLPTTFHSGAIIWWWLVIIWYHMTAWSLIAFLSQLSTLKLTNLGWTSIYSDRSSYLQDSEYNIHLPFHCRKVAIIFFFRPNCVNFLIYCMTLDMWFCVHHRLQYDASSCLTLTRPIQEGGNPRRFISHKEWGDHYWKLVKVFQYLNIHCMKLMKCW